MKIVAVDDEKLALSTLVNSIRKVAPAADCNGFTSPLEALNHIKNNGCDVAFLDIKMRGMTGLELARQIKELSCHANIIFVTGYSEYSLDAFRLYASDYILKPATPTAVQHALDNLRTPVLPETKNVIRFQCFGNFEVFANGQPLSFKRAKSKELLAYLVDRRGSGVSMQEIISVLWEDAPESNSVKSNLRNLIVDIKHTLSAVNAENIITKTHNSIAVNRALVDCDYYDFLNLIPYAVNSYNGEYMLQYSWAEITTAALSFNEI